MSMWKPTENKLIVRYEDHLKGPLFVAKGASKKVTGTVVAVAKNLEDEIKEGSPLIFNDYGQDVGEGLRIINVEDVICLLKTE